MEHDREKRPPIFGTDHLMAQPEGGRMMMQ
jgi:hypothetical protein